jgi:branched-chain amino acid transport system substrate-binding protein
LLIPLALLLAISLIVIGCPAPPATTPPATTPPATTPPATTPPAQVQMVKMGTVLAITGYASGFGVPATNGAEVWVDEFNANGGITMDGVTYKIEFHKYDAPDFDPTAGLQSVKKAVLEDGVTVLLTFSGSAYDQAIQPVVAANNVLTFTWGATQGMGPYIISSFTYWPQLVALTYQYVAENHPEIKRVAISYPDAPWGIDEKVYSRAGTRAMAGKFEVVYDDYFPASTIDWSPIITKIMMTNPDLIAIHGVAPEGVGDVVKAGMDLGYQGRWMFNQWDLDKVLEKVPASYIEGGITGQPSLNNPSVVGPEIANLWTAYGNRWPGFISTLAASSWYAQFLWEQGVQMAGTADSETVYNTLINTNPIDTLLGESYWGGQEVYGVNNFLMTPWYIGEMQNGEPVITDKISFYDWYQQFKDILVQVEQEEGQLP